MNAPFALTVTQGGAQDLLVEDAALSRASEFFSAHIENPNTRAAYQRAIAVFFRWCKDRGIGHFSQVTPAVVAAWVKDMRADGLKAPTVKQRLAALKSFLDFMVSGGALPFNPATSVRGPKYSIARGITPVLTGAEAAQLLASIDISTDAGLRDRALIALMTYTFARIGAVTRMTVADVFPERNRIWVRLHEKGGKLHEMPCHHTLEDYILTYLEKTGLQGQMASPLFPTLTRAGKLSERPLHRVEAWAMVKRRAIAAGVLVVKEKQPDGTTVEKSRVVNHTFRATGITAYLENGGVLERARAMANHSSSRTTQLYDRRNDRATLDDVERIRLE